MHRDGYTFSHQFKFPLFFHLELLRQLLFRVCCAGDDPKQAFAEIKEKYSIEPRCRCVWDGEHIAYRFNLNLETILVIEWLMFLH